MYLLDTDTVIYILKGHPTVEQNLQRRPHDPIKLCVITLMELYYGAYKSQKVTGNLAKIRTLENSLEILSVGQDLDLILGCCALAHNLTLVTNNVRHFRKIESLRVVDWAKETD
jgi:predicted nucleic acid-binding protein